MARQAKRETLLKVLLTKRHLVTHRAFRLEYDKVARKLDKRLIASAPGREQYARWLAGQVKTKPSADHCRVLEHMFPGHTVAELLAPYDPESDAPGVSPTPSRTEEAATNRRHIFHLGAVVAATGLLDGLRQGPVQLEQALHSTTISEGGLALLEAEAERFGLPGRRVPPEVVIQEVLLGLSGVWELLKNHQPIATQRRLARVAAQMSFVIADHLLALHQPGLARRWWQTSLRAAEEAGDRHLADHAYAAGAYFPTYSGDPQRVLAYVTPRLEQAAKATPSVAWMWGFAAMAHAVLGDRSAFERANDAAHRSLDRCDPDSLKPSMFSHLPSRQMLYETRGRADLGDVKGTGEAAAAALSAVAPDATTEPALTRLAYAGALAKAGEVEEACSLATIAIQSRKSPSFGVVVRAREFDALLNSKHIAVREWREALASVRTPA